MERRHVDGVEKNGTCRRGNKSIYTTQERALARPGGTDERDHFSPVDRKAHTPESSVAGGISLGKIRDCKQSPSLMQKINFARRNLDGRTVAKMG